jgi:hypothetical protein
MQGWRQWRRGRRRDETLAVATLRAMRYNGREDGAPRCDVVTPHRADPDRFVAQRRTKSAEQTAKRDGGAAIRRIGPADRGGQRWR